LKILIDWLSDNLKPDYSIYADLIHEKAKPIVDLFNSIRPDLAIKWGNTIAVLELTVCHETNLINSKVFKENKYKNIADQMSSIITHCSIKCFTVEISCLGFVSDVSGFCKFCSLSELNVNVKRQLIYSVLHDSFDIYAKRNCPTK
jgi:hypothetical protein